MRPPRTGELRRRALPTRIAALRRAPLASAALLILTALTAASASAGAVTWAAVAGGAERLFAASEAPDWVQMHAGPVDSAEIAAFAASRPEVRDHQVATVLRLENAGLVLDGRSDAARTGVMEILLVTQSERFDILLGSDDVAPALGRGEIAVPVFYMREYDLEPGDTISVAVGGSTRSFVIADRLRDAQMNPGIVNSKRFLLHDADWAELAAVLPQQSIVTFQTDGDAVALADAYRAAGLPADGPAVDGALLRLIGSITDGVVAACFLLVALVVFAVSALCLRLVILTTLENERSRIVLLRMLGFSSARVVGEYLVRYAVVAAVGVGLGMGAAVPLTAVLTAGVVADTGGAPGTMAAAVAVGAGATVLVATICSAALVLRRVRRLSPVAATQRSGAPPATWLPASALVPVPLWLGIRSRLTRPAGTVLLLGIVVIAMVIAVVPLRLAQTVASPDFVATMGIGQSDVRVFVPATAPSGTAAAVLDDLRDAPHVVRSAMSTSRRVAVAAAGYEADLVIETVDASVPSPMYSSGHEPGRDDEVALSLLAAQTWGVGIGDTVRLGGDEGPRSDVEITGLYQDITNGGRSARTLRGAVPGPVAWQTVTADVAPGSDVQRVVSDLEARHPTATVTSVGRFVEQTLGGTIETLRASAIGAASFAAGVLILVVLLLTRLESVRDRRGLRALRTIGFTAGSVRATVALRAIIVAAFAAPLGVVAAEALAPAALGAILSALGGGAVALPSDALPAAVTVAIAVVAVAASSAVSASIPSPVTTAFRRKDAS
ncbi:MAG: transporter permease [Microbacterium sp.]|jgi:putative ABC transport system permease protein|uniref:ABC transporter permease n=1 Tax=Microbacterium sp. TaxID=51671 RepID=UPI0026287CDF|nr:ABC transporter permease [Microbacterium sp.]MDF2560514.1 transporter permease [Microbacterium sp.]